MTTRAPTVLKTVRQGPCHHLHDHHFQYLIGIFTNSIFAFELSINLNTIININLLSRRLLFSNLLVDRVSQHHLYLVIITIIRVAIIVIST